MFTIKFEGTDKIFESDSPISVYEAAKASELIDRSVIAARINEKVHELSTVIDADAEVKLLTFSDTEGKRVFWHTASHILAQAVKRLYPEAKLTIGPAIETGFYYDIDSGRTRSRPDVLAKLESEMQKIVKENLLIERFELLQRDEAVAFMKERDEPYKVQLIDELPEGEDDLVLQVRASSPTSARVRTSTPPAHVKAVKLLQCAGAYWTRRSRRTRCSKNLRHGVPGEGRAERAPCADGGSEEARPQQARPRARVSSRRSTSSVRDFRFFCRRARASFSCSRDGSRISSRRTAICSRRPRTDG